jgi:hypothetical protein
MDWFDRRIVNYVLMWAPYGRLPDEDVFPEFGMTAHQLWVRFTVVVSNLTSRDGDLDERDRALIARARTVAPPPLRLKRERDQHGRNRRSPGSLQVRRCEARRGHDTASGCSDPTPP